MTWLPADTYSRTLPTVRSTASGRSRSFGAVLLAIGLDAIALWTAFWLAYELRYSWEIGGQVFEFNQRVFADFYQSAALFIVLCLGVFIVRGVYRLSSWTSLLDEMGLVAGSVTMAMGAFLLTAYLSQFSPSRLLFVYVWALSLVALLFVRIVSRRFREALWAHDIGVRRVLIVGNGATGRRFMQLLLTKPAMGLRVAGYVDDGRGRGALIAGTDHGVARIRRLGALQDLPSILDRTAVDEVILALPSDGHGQALEIANWCRSANVPFRLVPDLLQLSLDRVHLDEISGVPILSVREASIRGANAAIKRGLDIVGSLGLLFIFAGPMLLAASATRRKTGGPILQRRTMVGRAGVPFTQLRFAPGSTSFDDAVHPGWIFRTHLDGAPQLLNVLRNEMSLIGPRAQTPVQVSGYRDWQRQRLLIAPGMTGLWFSNGRTDLTFDEMVRLDLFYAEHWSFWLDLKILLRTMLASLRGRPHR